MIGHFFFGARMECVDPLFVTVSPSFRHSGLVARLSRYGDGDPAMLLDANACSSVST